MGWKKFLVTVVQALFIFQLLAQAQSQSQDQSGFISIDCGISGVSRYTDTATNISYFPDTGFTEAGENREVDSLYKPDDDTQLLNLRSFPQGTRNCYTVKPAQGKGTRYLVRARFMYGNYDSKLRAPTFDLYIGANLWATVRSSWNLNTHDNLEIIYVPSSDHINVCLVNTGDGTPFISALELRHIGNEIYLTKAGTGLQLINRYDFGSESGQQVTRFKDDIYDRLWIPSKEELSITTTLTNKESFTLDEFKVPFSVMSTATTNTTTNYHNINFLDVNETSNYLFYMHFAEVEKLSGNQTREFNIYLNNELWYGPVNPKYLTVNTIRSESGGSKSDSEGRLALWFNNTDRATMPPLINSMELYALLDLPQEETNQTDVEAISNVKSVYGLKRMDWQGDPCAPEVYKWNGLNCSYTDNNPPRIISLNLSSSGLKGEIATSISKLTMLEHLDLSNNQLVGRAPDFLGQLSLLKSLNLRGNNFTGPVPESLLSKKDLQLGLDTYLINTTPCCAKKKSFVVPLVASVSGVLFVVLIVGVVVWNFRRRRQQNVTNDKVETANAEAGVVVHPGFGDGAFGSKKQRFAFSEIQSITNNFETVLGEGGFGKVYHGYLNGNQVAVKMLSSPSDHGRQQFHTEIKLLLRVHHKNLTTLVGYCNEGTNIGLIYEYMAMGNLLSHILEIGQSILSWEDRLRIAVDTAQGLEYLHSGCRPPIIHRDVKSTNILLNEKFQAKLGDFGLSKIFPLGVGNRTSTTSTPGMTASVAGTPGYLDPEYYITNWLNEKSDVYSFGVVLLELITAQPVLMKTRENNHIVEWVSSVLATGDITNILNPRLSGICDVDTVWKAIEIAMSCASKTAAKRPVMSQVTTELKKCLMESHELTRKESHDVADHSKDSSVEIISGLMVSEFSPMPR